MVLAAVGGAIGGIASGAGGLAGKAVGVAGAVAPFAAMAGGGILSGFFGSTQKKNEAAIAKYNAAVTRMQAEAVRIRTKFMQVRQAEAGARIEGELRASIGGAGIVATQGAPLLAMALQRSEDLLQNYMIGYEGRLEAEQLENQALQYDMQKKMLRIGARQSMIGGFLGAGAAVGQGLAMIPQKQTSSFSSSAASTGSGAYGGTGGGPTGGASRSMIG